MIGSNTTTLVSKYRVAVVFLLAIFATGCATSSVDQPWGKGPDTQAATAIEKQWGVRVIGIRRTAMNYMLDFRFRVLDTSKVGEIMDRKVRPVLKVEGRDIKLNVPVTSKLGSLRQSAKYAKANTNYFMMFSNPGKVVKQGDKVTIRIGDFKVEHLVVQ